LPTYREDLAILNTSETASTWLKAAARTLDDRDGHEALRDATKLVAMANKRITELYRGTPLPKRASTAVDALRMFQK
jgi:hypothetical protein